MTASVSKFTPQSALKSLEIVHQPVLSRRRLFLKQSIMVSLYSGSRESYQVACMDKNNTPVQGCQ